jgi:hypothetical protein
MAWDELLGGRYDARGLDGVARDGPLSGTCNLEGLASYQLRLIEFTIAGKSVLPAR